MDVNLLPNPFARNGLKIVDLFLRLLSVKKNQPIPTPKRLLLCHSGHLGDLVLMTSLLKPLKESFPGLRVGMLVGSKSSCVVEDHPLVDQIHICDHWKTNRGKKRFFTYFKRRFSIAHELRGYDVAVDCPFHFPNFAPLLFQAKIPVRIGYDTAGFSPLLTHVVRWKEKKHHAAHNYFDLLRLLGVEDRPLKPFLMADERRPLEREYIILHMGSGNRKIEWPEWKWRELVKQLGHHTLVFTGYGMRDKKRIEDVAQGAHLNLCDQLSWKEFVRWICHAKAVVSVETVAGHIASAFDVPTISLYAGLNPLDRWRPLSEKAKVLSHKMPCAPCYKGCKSMKCLSEIGVDEVYKELFSL